MKTKPIIHILLRFSDSLLKDKDTIEAHNEVVRHSGAVWFGKMGSPVSQHYIDLLNQQVDEGISTFVYLVKGNRSKSTAYRSSMIIASKSLPEGEQQFVPPYYSDLGYMRYMRFWAKMSGIAPITFEDLSKMRVASSVIPIRETLIKSSTGHFFLVEDKFLF